MMPDKKAVRDVSKFASLSEQILQGMLPGAKPQGSAPMPSFSRSSSLDIKRIKVPDSLVESIVTSTKKKTEEIKAPQEVVSEEVVIENKIENLVKRLSDLLEEAKQLMSEETFSGSLSVGKKPRKRRGKH